MSQAEQRLTLSTEDLLDFEALHLPARAKARAIRERFGVSTTAYHQQLARVLDAAETFVHAPALVARLRRIRDRRRELRTVHVLPGNGSGRHRPDPRQQALDLPAARPRREGRKHVSQLSFGDALKQLGMLRADQAANPDWKERVDEAIAALARARDEYDELVRFTAEDVRALAGDPPNHPNAMGARFNAAARRGLIRKVAYRLSGRPTLHRHPIAVWQGYDASPAEAAA